MARLAAVVAAGTVLVALAVGPAMASSSRYDGSLPHGGVVGLTATTKGGEVKSIETFEFEGKLCGPGGDTFSGGASKPIKVKDDQFESRQPVGFVEADLTLKVSGEFKKHGKKVVGTLKISGGGCKGGNLDFEATKQQG